MVIVSRRRSSYGLKTRYGCSGEPSDMGLIGGRSSSNCSARNSSCTRRRSWYGFPSYVSASSTAAQSSAALKVAQLSF